MCCTGSDAFLKDLHMLEASFWRQNIVLADKKFDSVWSFLSTDTDKSCKNIWQYMPLRDKRNKVASKHSTAWSDTHTPARQSVDSPQTWGHSLYLVVWLAFHFTAPLIRASLAGQYQSLQGLSSMNGFHSHRTASIPPVPRNSKVRRLLWMSGEDFTLGKYMLWVSCNAQNEIKLKFCSWTSNPV